MADTKISNLPAYPGTATPGANDLLVIVDTSNATYVSRKTAFSTTTNLAVGASGTPRFGPIKFLAGTNVTITDNADGTFTFNASGGGGGGAFTSITSLWGSNNQPQKDAYTAPSTPNNSSVIINFVVASGAGQVSNAQVSFNGTQATGGPYTSTGTFPNLTFTIAQADVPAAAQTAATVNVTLTGTFASSPFALGASALTNRQPIPFNATLTGAFVPPTVIYTATTANVNYAYGITGTATGYAGTIAGVAAAFNLTSLQAPVAGGAIAGTVTGNGQYGAPQGVLITLSGNLPPVGQYVPAYFVLTANSTPPTFPGTAGATPGAAAGSLITYPLATASTQYAWIATTLPLSRILFVTTFGNVQFVPDVTAPTQTISGQTFNVFGATGLDTLNPLQFQITAS